MSETRNIKIGLIGGTGLGAAMAQQTEGRRHELDTPFGRPSDAIALALRTEAPIFVAQTVLDQAQTISPDGEDQDEKVKKWFEQLDNDDLGKYKM